MIWRPSDHVKDGDDERTPVSECTDKVDSMSALRRLQDKLVEMGVRNISFSWAPGAEKLTKEERAAEVIKMFEAIERGDYEEMKLDDDEHSGDSDGTSLGGPINEEAYIRSILSVVNYDVRESCRIDLERLLAAVRASPATLAAEYTRGREDGFDAGKLSVASATKEPDRLPLANALAAMKPEWAIGDDSTKAWREFVKGFQSGQLAVVRTPPEEKEPK